MIKLFFLKSTFIFLATVMFSAPVVSGSKDFMLAPVKYLLLETDSKQSFKVYVSGPVNARRGILLMHGWWGLNKDMELWAEEFAEAGYRVVVVDLYDNKVAANTKMAKKLMNSVNQIEANKKYAAALKLLKASDRKLAVIGWSFGGSQALQAALLAPDLISATVIFYPFGTMVMDRKRLSALNGPILGQFAKHDFAFTGDKVKKFKAAMKNAGKKLEVHTYDAKHGFYKPGGKNYNKSAHDKARSITFKFLDKHL